PMASNSGKKPSQRELKKEESRTAIARAAVRLFEEKGFDATTMDEIAQAAGVSRPTVFNYFAHKEDILLVLGVMMGERIASRIMALDGEANSVDPIATLRQVVITMGTSFAEYPETSRAFHALRVQAMRSRSKDHPPMRGLPGDNEFAQATRFMAALVERAQRQEILRADFKANELLAHVLIGLFASVMGVWTYRGGAPSELPDMLERHFDITLNGIRA
ncbi:MAG TPA: TetR/AcrR family transcriptional regulator, partial [Stenomitos sp.]